MGAKILLGIWGACHYGCTDVTAIHYDRWEMPRQHYEKKHNVEYKAKEHLGQTLLISDDEARARVRDEIFDLWMERRIAWRLRTGRNEREELVDTLTDENDDAPAPPATSRSDEARAIRRSARTRSTTVNYRVPTEDEGLEEDLRNLSIEQNPAPTSQPSAREEKTDIRHRCYECHKDYKNLGYLFDHFHKIHVQRDNSTEVFSQHRVAAIEYVKDKPKTLVACSPAIPGTVSQMPPEIQEIIFQHVLDVPQYELGSRDNHCEEWTRRMQKELPAFMGSASLREQTVRVLQGQCSLVQLTMRYMGLRTRVYMGFIAAEIAKVSVFRIGATLAQICDLNKMATLQLDFTLDSNDDDATDSEQSESDFEEPMRLATGVTADSVDARPASASRNIDFKSTTALFAFEESSFRQLITAVNNFAWDTRYAQPGQPFGPPTVTLEASFPNPTPSLTAQHVHKRAFEVLRFVRGLDDAIIVGAPAAYPVNALLGEMKLSAHDEDAVMGFFIQALTDSNTFISARHYDSTMLLCERTIKRCPEAFIRLGRLNAGDTYGNLLQLLKCRLQLARLVATSLYLNERSRAGTLSSVNPKVMTDALNKFAPRAADFLPLTQGMRAKIHCLDILPILRYLQWRREETGTAAAGSKASLPGRRS